MFTSEQMTLLELKAIIKEMIESHDDMWHSRESVDAKELEKKQDYYWAKVADEKKKKKPGFFASLFGKKR